MNRCSFFKVAAVAPIAAPVAMKQAAASMGLSSAANAAGLGLSAVTRMGGGGNANYECDCPTPMCEADYSKMLKDRIADLVSPWRVKERRREAEQRAFRLSASRAAWRSVSPAAAYTLQIDECEQRMYEEELAYRQRELNEWKEGMVRRGLKGLLG